LGGINLIKSGKYTYLICYIWYQRTGCVRVDFVNLKGINGKGYTLQDDHGEGA